MDSPAVTAQPSELERRNAELERRNAELEQRITGLGLSLDDKGHRQGGHHVVFLLFGLIAAALVTALTMWFTARRPATAAAPKEPLGQLTVRVDEAAQALEQALGACVREASLWREPVRISLRGKLTAAGTLGLAEANVTPQSEQLVPCVRRAPSLVHVSTGTEPVVDLLFHYASSREADGTHETRARWSTETASKP